MAELQPGEQYQQPNLGVISFRPERHPGLYGVKPRRDSHPTHASQTAAEKPTPATNQNQPITDPPNEWTTGEVIVGMGALALAAYGLWALTTSVANYLVPAQGETTQRIAVSPSEILAFQFHIRSDSNIDFLLREHPKETTTAISNALAETLGDTFDLSCVVFKGSIGIGCIAAIKRGFGSVVINFYHLKQRVAQTLGDLLAFFGRSVRGLTIDHVVTKLKRVTDLLSNVNALAQAFGYSSAGAAAASLLAWAKESLAPLVSSA